MKIMQVFGKVMERKCWALAGAGGLLVASCATYEGGPPSPAYSPSVGEAASGDSAVTRNSVDGALNSPASSRKSWNASPPVEERPGLGTGWGERIRSEMGHTSFARASSRPYSGVATIYYNDKDGVNAMTSWKYSGKGMQKAANGLVEWGVKGTFGSWKNYQSSGRRYVVGRSGQRYTLVVKNLAKSRLEMVLSVDGLDVLDGKSASMRKRGYIVSPGQTLEVKGWRTSHDAVAAFKFSSVSGSYAGRSGAGTRNVGVIGLAVFTEKGVDPWTWMPAEVRRRESASPFAEPPLQRGR